MTTNRPIVLLNEAFPDWFDGDGIFSEMGNTVPWHNVIDPSLLDMDYFGNHSGMKKCSPLVYALMEDDYTVSDLNREKIASLVLARFLPNWTALWNTYHRAAGFDPLKDYSITESGSNEEGESTSHTNSKNGTNTGTDNFSTVHGETIGVQKSEATNASQGKYGFNSAESVPTDTASSTTTGSQTEQHSGTDQNNRTLNLANSETVNGSERTDRGGSYSKTRSGLTGNHTIQSIIREERELWIDDFFTRVYSDIDMVVASLIYNREHHTRGIPLIGLGYYQI